MDYSSGSYEFDYRVVWRRLSDGVLLTARDSGCSCPTPFEYIGIPDLAEVGDLGWIKEEIAEEMKDLHGNSNLAQDSAKFLEDIEKARKKK